MFYCEVTPLNSNGECDAYFSVNDDTVYEDEDLEDGKTIKLGFLAEETNDYWIEIELDFDSYYYSEPMQMRVSNAKATSVIPTNEVSFVDFRTLETFDTQEVPLFSDAELPKSTEIPTHEGYAFSRWDDANDAKYVTEDRTIYARYTVVTGGGGMDNSVPPNGMLTELTAFTLPEGITLTNGEPYPWNAYAALGFTYIQASNSGAGGTTSSITLNLPAFTGNKVIAFEFFVSSEKNWDELSWGEEDGQTVSGTDYSDWTTVAIKLDESQSEGSIEFKYSKDGSVDDGWDSAYIRNIRFGDAWNVNYTLIDTLTGEVIKSGEVQIGTTPDLPELPTHEGMVLKDILLSTDAEGNMTYRVVYREDYDPAGNIEGGELQFDISMFSMQTGEYFDTPYLSIETEGDRDFLRYTMLPNGESTNQVLVNYSKSLEGFTKPVLVFEYRAYYSGNIYLSSMYNGLNCSVKQSSEWQTMYFPLPEGGERVALQFNCYRSIPEGMAVVDYDNFRIIEGGSVNITYRLENGDEDDTIANTVDKYTRFNASWYPSFATMPADCYPFGYTEQIGFVTEDIDVYVRCLPKKDRTAVFADPTQTALSISDPDTMNLLAITPMTIDGREALGAAVSSRYSEVESISERIQFNILECPKEYIAIDVKAGPYDSVTIEYSSDGDKAAKSDKDERTARATSSIVRQLYNTGGEWTTVYIPAVAGNVFSFNLYRNPAPSVSEEPIEFAIDNIRFVDSVEKVTVTFKDLDTGETLGTKEVDKGTLVSELTYLEEFNDLPEGKVTAGFGYQNVESQIINEDTTLYAKLEDAINLDYALNAEGRSLEFDNYAPYQWHVAQMDGRTVAIPNEKLSSNWAGEIDLELELNPGDTLMFDYKLSDPNQKATVHAVFEDRYDYTRMNLTQSNEWETASIVAEDEKTNFYIYIESNNALMGENSYDPEFEFALDNFRVIPGETPVVRGTYGQTLEDLSGQLPEGWEWVDDSITPDVVNGGYEVTFTPPTDEKMYSATIEPIKAEVIILPFNLQEDSLVIRDVAEDGTMDTIELPPWVIKNPSIVLGSGFYGVQITFFADLNMDGVDPRNFIGDGTEFSILLTAYDMGDCDLSGEVTAADASSILRHIVKLITLEDLQKQAGDIDQSGDLEASDAAKILRFIVKLQSTLHITP